jgi:hypothetical protein
MESARLRSMAFRMENVVEQVKWIPLCQLPTFPLLNHGEDSI